MVYFVSNMTFDLMINVSDRNSLAGAGDHNAPKWLVSLINYMQSAIVCTTVCTGPLSGCSV